MNKKLKLIFAIVLCMIMVLGFATACNNDKGSNTIIGSNGNWWIDGKDTGIFAGEPTTGFYKNASYSQTLMQSVSGRRQYDQIDTLFSDFFAGKLTHNKVGTETESVLPGNFFVYDYYGDSEGFYKFSETNPAAKAGTNPVAFSVTGYNATNNRSKSVTRFHPFRTMSYAELLTYMRSQRAHDVGQLPIAFTGEWVAGSADFLKAVAQATYNYSVDANGLGRTAPTTANNAKSFQSGATIYTFDFRLNGGLEIEKGLMDDFGISAMGADPGSTKTVMGKGGLNEYNTDIRTDQTITDGSTNSTTGVVTPGTRTVTDLYAMLFRNLQFGSTGSTGYTASNFTMDVAAFNTALTGVTKTVKFTGTTSGVNTSTVGSEVVKAIPDNSIILFDKKAATENQNKVLDFVDGSSVNWSNTTEVATFIGKVEALLKKIAVFDLLSPGGNVNNVANDPAKQETFPYGNPAVDTPDVKYMKLFDFFYNSWGQAVGSELLGPRDYVDVPKTGAIHYNVLNKRQYRYGSNYSGTETGTAFYGNWHHFETASYIETIRMLEKEGNPYMMGFSGCQ